MHFPGHVTVLDQHFFLFPHGLRGVDLLHISLISGEVPFANALVVMRTVPVTIPLLVSVD